MSRFRGCERVETSDENLVARYQDSGCSDSLDCLLGRYSDELPKMLSQIGVTESACSDLTQDILVRAFRSLDHFEGRSAFRTWITRIAINRARDHFREVTSRKEQTNHDLSLIHI